MDGRDAKGRFKKGNQFGKGKGRPNRNTEEKYLKVFSDTVTEQDLREIILSVMAFAKSGDMVAVRLVFDYAFGKPQQQVQVDMVSDVSIALKWSEDADDHDNASTAT